MAQKSSLPSDPRIKRTRKLLQDAMIALTIERGFAAITVADITERAEMNRSTFYRHYLDKYDLLYHFLDDAHAGIARKTDRLLKLHGSSPGPIVMIEHIQEYSAFYRHMLGAKGDPHFIQRFRENSERRYRELLAKNPGPDPDGPPVDMRVRYASWAGIGAILWWLENDQPSSAEQLAAWLVQLTRASVGLSMPPEPPGPPSAE